MKNTHFFHQNVSFKHWNRENRVIFEAKEALSEAPTSEIITGQDIINAASFKKNGQWETDWKLVNILREKTEITTFRTEKFTLDTVSSHHITKQEFLEKLKRITKKKERVRAKSTEKRQEIVKSIAEEAEKRAEKKGEIETGTIDKAQARTAEPRVGEFTETTREEAAPSKDTAENLAEGSSAMEKLLENLNGAVANHSEAVRKLSTYQELTDRIKLDEKNIATLFGIQVSSKEGLIGLLESGNDQGELTRFIEERFPKTQDETGLKNFAKEFGIFAGKSGMATALANSINFLVASGNPNIFFALAKLGTINTGIQSGHLTDSIKETDLMFLGEFMRLSKIIETPKNPAEKKQAEEDLKKLIADDEAGRANYTLISENIALSAQALHHSEEDLAALRPSITEALADGNLNRKEKEFFEKMKQSLSESIQQDRTDIDESKETTNAELKQMTEELDDLLGGIDIDRKLGIIPVPNVKKLGHFLKTFGGVKEEKLETAMTRYRSRLDAMLKKKTDKIEGEKEIRTFRDQTRQPSFTQFEEALRAIYGEQKTMTVMNQAYSEYLGISVEKKMDVKGYESLIALAKRDLFPTLKKEFPETTINFAQIGGMAVRDTWNNLAKTDICKKFIENCIKERALDQLGTEFRLNYENFPHKEALYQNLQDALSRAGLLEDALLKTETLNSFVGKALADNLPESIGETGLSALTKLANDVAWAENLAGNYENIDATAMRQNVEIHPDVPGLMQEIMKKSDTVVTDQKETSGKLFAAIVSGDQSKIKEITDQYTENAGKTLKTIHQLSDQIDALQGDKPAIIEAHDSATEKLAQEEITKYETAGEQDKKEIAETCVAVNQTLKEMAPDTWIPVSVDTFETKEQALDFQALVNIVNTVDPQSLTDWTKFQAAMTKMGIKLAEHKTPATTSRYGMIEGPDGKINGYFANNINMLMLLLPERKDGKLEKPPIPETIRTVGKHLGINLTNSEIMNAVAKGTPIDTANLSAGTPAPYLNTGVDYYPAPGEKNYNFQPKGYQVSFDRTFFTPDGKLTLTYDIVLRDKCFNVNIPQEELIKAVLEKYPPTPTPEMPEIPKTVMEFSSYLGNMQSIWAGYGWGKGKSEVPEFKLPRQKPPVIVRDIPRIPKGDEIPEVGPI